MGIKNLYKFLLRFAPESIVPINLEDISGSTVAIDINLYIYKLHSVAVNYNIKNKTGGYINHLQGLLFKISELVSHNITPICVFDGKPPVIKGNTIKARKEKNSISTYNIFNESRELLLHMGIQYIDAPSEAEAQCAAMNTNNLVDYVVTDDLDALVFGANKVIKGFGKKSETVCIDRAKILEALQLTQYEFINLCILLGSDYTCSIPQVGPIKANKLIQQYRNINSILAGESLTVPPNFKYIEAIDEFTKPIVNTNIVITQRTSLNNKSDLIKYLVDIHGLNLDKVRSSIDKLI